VDRAALAALGARSSSAALQAASQALARHDDRFALRVLAAQALGRLGSGGGAEEAARGLRDAAAHDSYALVREAALTSLASFDPAGARALAAQMVASDPEPRVRDAARAMLSGPRP
jgi:HEAT repeat protein